MDNNIDEPEEQYGQFVVATWGILNTVKMKMWGCTYKHPWHHLIMQEYYLDH